MNIQDVRVLAAGQAVRCDVCIVGAGPVGLTLAAECAGASLSILVLESGGRAPDPWADALNATESVGAPRVADQTKVRNRGFGGSSQTWSGRLAAFDAIDFAARPWVPHSGWPIPREALARYLPRTVPHLGAALADNTDPVARRAALGDGADRFDPRLLEDYVWTYSRGLAGRLPVLPTDAVRFGPRAAASTAPDIRCLVNATLVHIDTDADGTAVTGLAVRGPDGLTRRVLPRATILCGGGIENARMLLASHRIVRGGVGNARDQVGRYLMDHPRGVSALAAPGDVATLHRLFGSRRRPIAGRPAVVMQGAALSRAAQEREGLLNCAVWYNGVVAAADPYALAGRLARGRGWSRDSAVVLAREAGFVAAGAARLAVTGRTPPRRLAELELLAMVEQCPDPHSRVTLGAGVDAFGMPRSRIDWRVDAREKQSIVATTQYFIAESRRLGLPVPVIVPGLLDPGTPLDFLDSAHPMGTTRMSADPATGVVDADCAVHGVAGLFVAGASVFPTGGHTNPTQTALALAIRLADHLRARLRTSVPVPIGARDPVAPPPGAIPAVPVAASSSGPVRVLVTGGTGRVGSAVVAHLVRRGYAVRALTSRMPAPQPGVEWIARDLRRSDLDFSAEVSGCAAILHLGAEMRHVEDMPLVNGVATGALARAAEAAGLRFLAYVSSVAVYGSALARICREDAPTVTADRVVPGETIANPWMQTYARTKRLGEEAVAAAARSVEYVVFRPTVVVDRAAVVAAIPAGVMGARLRGRRNAHHIYVGDVAEALVWAMERALARPAPVPGITTYNLSDETLADPTLAGLRSEARARGLCPAAPTPWPAALDRTIEYLRHNRGQRPRIPTPYLRFPADRLLGDGFRYVHGMRRVRDDAFAAMRRAAAEVDPAMARLS